MSDPLRVVEVFLPVSLLESLGNLAEVSILVARVPIQISNLGPTFEFRVAGLFAMVHVIGNRSRWLYGRGAVFDGRTASSCHRQDSIEMSTESRAGH